MQLRKLALVSTSFVFRIPLSLMLRHLSSLWSLASCNSHVFRSHELCLFTQYIDSSLFRKFIDQFSSNALLSITHLCRFPSPNSRLHCTLVFLWKKNCICYPWVEFNFSIALWIAIHAHSWLSFTNFGVVPCASSEPGFGFNPSRIGVELYTPSRAFKMQ